MDKASLLSSLQGTLDANPAVRKQCEQQLHVFEEQPGFTAYLLDLIGDADAAFGVQIAAAVFFKNRVVNYWVVPENRPNTKLFVQANEKPQIKEKLIQTLIKTRANPRVRNPLTLALHNVLSYEKWDELTDIIYKLLTDSLNIDHVFTGLLCLFEYTKNYRWHGLESASGTRNPVLDEAADKFFPLLEQMTQNLIDSHGDASADEMLYLIVKTFKFSTYSYLPAYLKDNTNLGRWCHLQIQIINKPLPQEVLNEDPDQRAAHPRLKAIKWCFGNLHRFLSRHGGGFATKDKENNEFAHNFLQNFVPEILNSYWTIIEAWSTKKVWLSEGALYHLISFLEQLIETPAWALTADKLEAIVKHVVLPTLNANELIVELYETDPDEYIRRFFDINRESNTSDVASINFIFRVSSKRFQESIPLLLSIINDILTRRAANRADASTAMETEGAFRILSTISYKLDKNASPVQGRVDELLHSFVYPELSAETLQKFPFLTARACDTLAMFSHKYHDEKVLQEIFQGVVQCFQQNEHFAVKLTAVDALRTLVAEELVADQVAQQSPQLMQMLLEMSNEFESDVITSVMDAFVDKFAVNLEPYANELSVRLVEQFIRIAHDLLHDSNNIDTGKEYQASGILNTLATLVIAMNHSPAVANQLQHVVKDMIKFILENSMVTFLTEAVEILESVLLGVREVTPTLWELFQSCIDSFDTYAMEYFDSFSPFFEAIINRGFSAENVSFDNQHVQAMLSVAFKVVDADNFDPIFASTAFELIELTILSMKNRFVPYIPALLDKIFLIFQKMEAVDAFDGYMLHYLAVLKIFFAGLWLEPSTVLQFLNEKSFVAGFFKLWIKYSDDFQSVYGCKLQILASLAILGDSNLALIGQQDLIGEVTDLLISNLEVLPSAIKAKMDLIERDAKGFEQDDDDEYGNAYDDDFEADEAELEAFKETPIDQVNVFEVFATKVTMLQHLDPERYQIAFGGLDESQKEICTKIVEISQAARK